MRVETLRETATAKLRLPFEIETKQYYIEQDYMAIQVDSWILQVGPYHLHRRVLLTKATLVPYNGQ